MMLIMPITCPPFFVIQNNYSFFQGIWYVYICLIISLFEKSLFSTHIFSRIWSMSLIIAMHLFWLIIRKLLHITLCPPPNSCSPLSYHCLLPYYYPATTLIPLNWFVYIEELSSMPRMVWLYPLLACQTDYCKKISNVQSNHIWSKRVWCFHI